MIVPDGKNWGGFAQLLETGLFGQLRIFRAHFIGIAGVEINIVAEEDEQIGLGRQYSFPDRLILGLLGARAKGDPRQGFGGNRLCTAG